MIKNAIAVVTKSETPEILNQRDWESLESFLARVQYCVEKHAKDESKSNESVITVHYIFQ